MPPHHGIFREPNSVHTDWSVYCGADDPIVVIPWASADGTTRYVDLRTAPSAIEEIPEAVRYPRVADALRRWNRADSPLFTSKCDIWNYPARLFDAEDLSAFAHGHGSYIDLVTRDPDIFASFSSCEKLLRAWTETAHGIDRSDGRCEFTLRPARIFPKLEATGESYAGGFSTTLYVWGYGDTPQAAEIAWISALEALTEPVILTAKSQNPRIVE